MKVIVYRVSADEKEPFAVANQKKHNITLVSNSLTCISIDFAKGKKAIVIHPADHLSGDLIRQLAEMGVKFISTRSADYGHIDIDAIKKYNFQLGNVPEEILRSTTKADIAYVLARETINNLDRWQIFQEGFDSYFSD